MQEDQESEIILDYTAVQGQPVLHDTKRRRRGGGREQGGERRKEEKRNTNC